MPFKIATKNTKNRPKIRQKRQKWSFLGFGDIACFVTVWEWRFGFGHVIFIDCNHAFFWNFLHALAKIQKCRFLISLLNKIWTPKFFILNFTEIFKFVRLLGHRQLSKKAVWSWSGILLRLQMQKVDEMSDFSNKDQMAKQPKPQNKASRRLPSGKIASQEATWLPSRAIKGPNRPKWPVGDPKLRPEASVQKGENWGEKGKVGGQRSKNGKGDFKGGKATGQGFRQGDGKGKHRAKRVKRQRQQPYRHGTRANDRQSGSCNWGEEANGKRQWSIGEQADRQEPNGRGQSRNGRWQGRNDENSGSEVSANAGYNGCAVGAVANTKTGFRQSKSERAEG